MRLSPTTFHGFAVASVIAGLGAAAARGEDVRPVVHPLMSKRQAGPTSVRVLVPKGVVPDRTYRVVYVLPVEAGDESRYGDGLKEIARLGLHDKHGVYCVAPTFHHLPWFADHPTDPKIAQEAYFLEDVIPFVEKTYPVKKERSGRLLLGFSKSGHGAFSLLLRHPDRFERAAAWDAPFLLDRPGKYGSGPIYGTDENFAQYRILPLLEKRAESLLGNEPRMALMGTCNFVGDHEATHATMEKLRIPHHHRADRTKPHDWHSGWVAPSMEWLCRD